MIRENRWTCGIDEVGRGSLAGPVYLSSVLLAPNFPVQTYLHDSVSYRIESGLEEFKLVRDSKKLGQKSRGKVAELIITESLYNHTLSASAQLIDTFGIGVCLSHMLAILVFEVVNQLKYLNIMEPMQIIVDGQIKLLDKLDPDLLEKLLAENLIMTCKIEQILPLYSNHIQNPDYKLFRENYADDKYLSVALASNLAKVQRDLLMTNLGDEFPEYSWGQNKGYGTLTHRQAIQKTPNNFYIRKSFIRKILAS